MNQKLNEGLAARYICLENLKFRDTKKLKEYNDSMFHELLKTENKMKKVEAENKRLQWDLKQCKGTLASLGNRYAPVEAIVEQINGKIAETLNKREKKAISKALVLPSIAERRADQKAACSLIIKNLCSELASFHDIMTYALAGRPNCLAVDLSSRGAFTDGFKIATGPYTGSLELQRFLNDHDIPSRLPLSHPCRGFKFVQLASQEHNITKTLKHIKEAYEPLRDEIRKCS